LFLKESVMSKAASKIFSHTHYAVSTVAAVLYGVAWLLGNNVRAQNPLEPAMLSPVVVTAKREPIVLDAIVVTAKRALPEQVAMLAPVYVTASRDARVDAAERETVASAGMPFIASNDAQPRVGVVRKARNWVLATLMK
jgi:hypothetical protein